MYGKVFESLYQGSLYGDWKAIITMQQLIVLADDRGIVDMTPQAISGTTSIPLDIINDGIAALLLPDPHSRTEGHEGVRIKPVDDHRTWGWFLVNYEKYKYMQSRKDRNEYMKNYMANERDPEKNKHRNSKFIPPTHKDVAARVDEMEYCHTDIDEFINFYECKNWMVGKNKMAKWEAALARWDSKNKKEGKPKTSEDGKWWMKKGI